MNFLQRYPELVALLKAAQASSTEITEWWNAILTHYDALGESLPKDHIWRRGKREHAKKSAEILVEQQAVFGLEGKEIALLSLLALAHDLGRVIQAAFVAAGKPRPDDQDHGRLSAEALREILNVDFESPFWKAALIAITKHSDRTSPSIEECGGDKAAHALSLLLRYVDKITNYDKAAKYTADAAEKEAQRHVNWPEQIKTDSDWGKEMAHIDPPHLVGQFQEWRTLDRQQCRSYEAYMLQYLAWLFDIRQPEILAIILKRGGPKIVMHYLERQLSSGPGASQVHPIRQTLLDYLGQYDLSLGE